MARRLLLHLRRRYSASVSSSAEDMVVSSLRVLSSAMPTKPAALPPPTDPDPDATATTPTLAATTLLSPAERLRGVFLLKPHGHAALHGALSSTGVDAAVALSPEVLSDVVNHGNFSGAATVDFFGWAITNSKLSPPIDTCNIVIRALGRRKFFAFFEPILEIMRKNNIFPDISTLEIIIDSLIAARHVNTAVQLINTDHFGLGVWRTCHRKEVFTVLINCLCRRSHIGLASSLLQATRGETIDLDTHLYNEVIGCWARFGRVDKVEHFWAMMLDDGVVPSEVSYCHLIEALGRANRAEEALQVFEKMVNEGYGPTTMAYNALIFNFISVGDLDRSIKYYKVMLDNNCPPNIDTYCKMIRAFLRECKVADALQMFDDMLARGILPSTGMITLFIEPLCTFGPPHAALLFYKSSRKAGCTISIKAYKLLLERLARFGKSGTVLQIWEEMQECGYPSDKEIYEFIVNGLCNVGKVDAAVSVVEESLRKGFCLGRVVYGKLNNKLLDMNKVETAYNLFKKVKYVRALSNSRSYCRANGWHF
ncbi:putative pentatricopeptide repeat-containing protein At5g43820 [Oryza brachyantha]|uniref:putative pentatricopeptide repeat-containing protein At5g43820 n=1 Tax=Oryza brachyantha TaxID=4533 RepID=UPI001ADAD364|nr:putative pentatricopeptide repeat-containing protein At5g43820 [Oryza brachyantha]